MPWRYIKTTDPEFLKFRYINDEFGLYVTWHKPWKYFERYVVFARAETSIDKDAANSDHILTVFDLGDVKDGKIDRDLTEQEKKNTQGLIRHIQWHVRYTLEIQGTRHILLKITNAFASPVISIKMLMILGVR